MANVQTDEQQIRQLVAAWMAATKAGDTDTALDLMTEDAVFLVPGRPVMRKAEFAAAAGAQAAGQAPQFDGTSEIQEIQVVGDWAFMWTHLTVVARPADGAAPIHAPATRYRCCANRTAHGEWRATPTCSHR